MAINFIYKRVSKRRMNKGTHNGKLICISPPLVHKTIFLRFGNCYYSLFFNFLVSFAWGGRDFRAYMKLSAFNSVLEWFLERLKIKLIKKFNFHNFSLKNRHKLIKFLAWFHLICARRPPLTTHTFYFSYRLGRKQQWEAHCSDLCVLIKFYEAKLGPFAQKTQVRGADPPKNRKKPKKIFLKIKKIFLRLRCPL